MFTNLSSFLQTRPQNLHVSPQQKLLCVFTVLHSSHTGVFALHLVLRTVLCCIMVQEKGHFIPVYKLQRGVTIKSHLT